MVTDRAPRASLCLSLGLVATAFALASPAAAQTPERNLHPCQIWTSCAPVIGPWVVAQYPGDDGYTLECPVPKNQNDLPQLVVGTDAVFATGGEPPGPLLAGYQTDGGGIGGTSLDFGLWEGNVDAPYKPAIGCAPHAATSIPFAQAAGIARRYRRRVRNVRVRPGGVVRVRLGCRRGERLAHSTSAVAFFTRRPPSPGAIKALEHRRRSTGSFTRAFAAAPPWVGDNERVELQVTAQCTRAGRLPADPPQPLAPCQWFGPKDANPSNGSCTPVIGPWVAVDQIKQIYTMMCPSGAAVGTDAQATTVSGPVPTELSVLVATSGYQGPGALGLNFGVWNGANSNDGGSYQPAVGCVQGEIDVLFFFPALRESVAPSTYRGQAAGISRRERSRVRTARVRPGAAVRVRQGCARRERLVRSGSAVAFFTRRPPSRRVVRSLERHHRRTGSVARASIAAPPGVGDNERVELQVTAICRRTR